MPITYAVVDDNVVLLQALIRNLNQFSELNLLFTATNGQQALELTLQHQPQFVLMDIDMPVLDGIRATTLIHSELPDTRILMLTIFDRDDKLFDAIKAGASGYLLKDESAARIVNAIEEAADGGAPMSPGIASRALAMLRRQPAADPDKKKLVAPGTYYLTPREVEILDYISQGLSTPQVATRLFLSDRTVRKHVENIYSKLHVHSRYEAIQLADRNNWFPRSRQE